MADITALITGRAFLEGPRWHDGALYVSDMHGDAVLRVTEDGDVSTVVDVEQPSGLGWLPDGSLLISSMRRRCVMRFDGSRLMVHADLSSLAPDLINDMCVDRHGHAFVGQFGFDMFGGGTPCRCRAVARRSRRHGSRGGGQPPICQRHGDHRRPVRPAGGGERWRVHHLFRPGRRRIAQPPADVGPAFGFSRWHLPRHGRRALAGESGVRPVRACCRGWRR